MQRFDEKETTVSLSGRTSFHTEKAMGWLDTQAKMLNRQQKFGGVVQTGGLNLGS